MKVEVSIVKGCYVFFFYGGLEGGYYRGEGFGLIKIFVFYFFSFIRVLVIVGYYVDE